MAYKKGAIDKVARKEGVWKEYDGGEFKISYLSAIDRIRMREATYDKVKDKDSKEERLEVNEEKQVKYIAEHILKDWKGIEDYKTDEPVPYSVEAAIEELTDSEELRVFILAVSLGEENYKRQKEDEKVEKVKKPSTGS